MSFDFDSFARDESFQSQINDLMQAIQDQGDPQLANRFADLRRRHKIENEEDPQPNFHFETAALTYEEVARHCAANGINLRRVVFVQGDRFYVSRNYAIGENQVWDEIASPSSVDIQQESAQLAFLDPKKTIVDWPLTLDNLNAMIRQKPYSEAMLRNCLLRFVNHYESAQTEYLRDKTCDQIANFLLSLNTRIDRKAYHKSRLLAAMRRPDETLSAAVHKVRNIAESIYTNAPGAAAAAAPGAAQPGAGAGGEPGGPGAAQPAANAANAVAIGEINPIVNRILINAIISFCRDDLAIALNKKVLADSSLSRLKDYTYYLRIAMAAEQRQNAFPTVPLKYSRKLPQSPDSFAALNSITVPDIHPCLHIAPRKNASSRLVENYFPYHTPDQMDDLNPFVNVNVGPPLMGPHLPLGHGADEEPAHAYVPQALVIPPAVPAQYYPPVPPQPILVPRPVPPVVPPVVVPQPAVPVQPVPAPAVPAAPVHQPRPAVAEPIYRVEGPNAIPPLPPLGAHALPELDVQLPVIRTIPWNELPQGAAINTNKDGQYIVMDGERYWIDFNARPPGSVNTRVVGTRTKSKNRPRSIQDRPLPEPRNRDRSGDGKDSDKANIYAEVLSMMMQNLTKPSGVPDRGRSRDRQFVPRSRDNSRDRARSGSRDRQQGRQPRRDGSWNRPGYNPANGPRDRLRTDRDRSPSRDRYGYRPTARSDQRQPTYYSQRDTYKKPNYSSSNRDRSRDEEQKRRDGSAEAKRLAREGAMKGPYRPRSGTPRDDRNRSRDRDRTRTPDRRDISRDRSYETKRQLLQEDAMTKAYPEMKRGMNCSANYNPAIKKNCTKCPLASAHHEFACRKYQRYNYNLCSLCEKYHHYPSECKEVPKYPPKQADTNSVYCTENDPN